MDQGFNAVADLISAGFSGLPEIVWVFGRAWVVPKGVPSFVRRGDPHRFPSFVRRGEGR